MALMPIAKRISLRLNAYKFVSPVRFGAKVMIDNSVPDEFKRQVEAAKPELEGIFPEGRRKAILAFTCKPHELMKEGIYRHIVILPSNVQDPSLENIKDDRISGFHSKLLGRFYGIKDNRYNNIFGGFLDSVKADLLHAQREYSMED